MRQRDRARRDFVHSAALAVTGLLAGRVAGAFLHTSALGDNLVASLLASIDASAAATIGRRALECGCVPGDPAVLARSLARDLSDASDAQAAFDALCRHEFAQGQVHDFGGFALADAECRLCALAALQATA